MADAPGPVALEASPRPGFAHERLLALSREAIGRVGLDLAGLTVLTEAASGPLAGR